MKTLPCVFCDYRVAVPDQLNDLTARVICSDCIARGGRMPRMRGPRPYRLRLDDQGRAFCIPWWEQARAQLFYSPGIATVSTVTLALLACVMVIYLIKAPVPMLLLGAFCGLVYWGWRRAMR